MPSPESPASQDPQDVDFDPSDIRVIEAMSDELWALFVQGLAPKGPAPRPAAKADAATPAPQAPDKPVDICIRAASGSVIKFRLAAFLMDKALLASAIETMIAERESAPRWDAIHGAQRVWDLYRAQQREKYGRRFTLDTDPL
jgi:hypothetical protein